MGDILLLDSLTFFKGDGLYLESIVGLAWISDGSQTVC